MQLPWQPNFGFYLSRLGEDPASFVVDLNAQPQASHPMRLQLRVPLLKPRADGLRDREELEPMSQLEDRLVDALEAKLDAIYVGRLVARGATEFFFYLPQHAEQRLADLEALLGNTAPYSLEYLAEADGEWRVYTQLLYPDPYSYQAIANRSLLEQLEQAGDQLAISRLVDHLAYFASRAQAKEAVTRLTAAGFATDDVTPSEDGRFGLQFHRDDALAEGQADAFVAEVLDIILPLDGDYDGWGCPVVKG